MAITTYADLVSKMVPRAEYNRFLNTAGTGGGHDWTSSWPTYGATDATLNGVIRDSNAAQVAGMLPFYRPAGSPDLKKSYLVHWEHQSQADQQNFGTRICLFAMLADRLWDNGGITINASPSGAAQAVTTPTWPERDVNQSSNGHGVFLAFEVHTAFGTGTTGVFYVDYTNSDGTARTGAAGGVGSTRTFFNAACVGTFNGVGLQAGDRGVRSVQNIYCTGVWPSGVVRLVAYRPIALLEVPYVMAQQGQDAFQLAMPQLFPGTVPWVINAMNGNNTRTALSGFCQWAHG
jgi:hypothetical protein